jgi:hypothetical protein
MSVVDRKIARPSVPESARCEACGSTDVVAIGKFCAGMGVLLSPFNEGVICRKCGHSGPFALIKLSETTSEE